MTPADDPGDADSRLFCDLAERLRIAHRRVAALPAGSEAKAAITRRLLVVSDAAKRDPSRASHRLDAVLADLDAASA